MAKGTAKGRARATAPSRYRYQYAVKFLCTSNIPGTSQTTTSLLPGAYATVVNIHNPNSKPTGYRMKLAAATSTETCASRSCAPSGWARRMPEATAPSRCTFRSRWCPSGRTGAAASSPSP